MDIVSLIMGLINWSLIIAIMLVSGILIEWSPVGRWSFLNSGDVKIRKGAFVMIVSIPLVAASLTIDYMFGIITPDSIRASVLAYFFATSFWQMGFKKIVAIIKEKTGNAESSVTDR